MLHIAVHNTTIFTRTRLYFNWLGPSMTGNELKEIREGLGLTLRELADRWEVDKRTVHREEQKPEVRGLYRDALKRVQDELESDSQSN